MKTQVFLALNRNGLVKATKGVSSLARDEIGVRLNITVPDSSFRSPHVDVNLTVPDEAVIQPKIDVEIVE